MQNSLSRNTIKVDRLYRLAAENNIPIDESCPESIVSMSVKLPNGNKIIGISKEEIAEHTKLECLAHELGHCLTDSFYAGYSPFELREKHERRANAWAVNEIVPFPDLCQAVKDGMRELWELSEHFNVSRSFMEKAIEYHKQRGLTVPTALYEEI